MTSEQIALVQSSFEKVVPIEGKAGRLFYERLLELDPSLRLLFQGDIQKQAYKLMFVLRIAVKSLSQLEALVPTVEALGRRHQNYGVKPIHYQLGGQALIWTLRQGLGEAFTAETEEAWKKAYALLIGVMLEATRKRIA